MASTEVGNRSSFDGSALVNVYIFQQPIALSITERLQNN